MTPGVWVGVGALVGACGVALGAFGAHGFAETADPLPLQWWQTAVDYHLVHALALLAVGVAPPGLLKQSWRCVAGCLFLAGVVLFCGALYSLALGAPVGVAHLAPLGGLALVAGWLALSVGALARRR